MSSGVVDRRVRRYPLSEADSSSRSYRSVPTTAPLAALLIKSAVRNPGHDRRPGGLKTGKQPPGMARAVWLQPSGRPTVRHSASTSSGNGLGAAPAPGERGLQRRRRRLEALRRLDYVNSYSR